MAIITYTQDAVLGAYQQWLMVQGANACLERDQRDQTGSDCAVQAGMVRAQAGSLLRYSVLTTLSSATVFFAGQLINDAGQWQNAGETVVGTSAGGIDQVTRAATAGCYKNMVASVGTATVAGSEVYVLVELGRTNNGVFTPYAVLLSGYVRTNEPIDSGGGPGLNNPPGGGGSGGCCLTTLYDATASGVESITYTVVVPSGANGRLIYAADTLSTSATVANRQAVLSVNPASGFGYQVYSTLVQPASTSYGYQWQIGGERVSRNSNTNELMPLPESVWFSGDFTVVFQQDNVQTGDNWLTADITYEIKGP